jgi:hypothetical protein
MKQEEQALKIPRKATTMAVDFPRQKQVLPRKCLL